MSTRKEARFSFTLLTPIINTFTASQMWIQYHLCLHKLMQATIMVLKQISPIWCLKYSIFRFCFNSGVTVVVCCVDWLHILHICICVFHNCDKVSLWMVVAVEAYWAHSHLFRHQFVLTLCFLRQSSLFKKSENLNWKYVKLYVYIYNIFELPVVIKLLSFPLYCQCIHQVYQCVCSMCKHSHTLSPLWKPKAGLCGTIGVCCNRRKAFLCPTLMSICSWISGWNEAGPTVVSVEDSLQREVTQK